MLTFDLLRKANKTRLPQFKNKKGDAAHSEPDGSDWSFATWMMATLGEFGELADIRLKWEAGEVSDEEYAREAGKEFADIVGYLDITAMRALDGKSHKVGISEPLIFLHIIATLGILANDTKKFHRGDFDQAEWKARRSVPLRRLGMLVAELSASQGIRDGYATTVSETGINLGEETVKKWNEVSERVGVKLQIGPKFEDSYASYAGLYQLVSGG